MATSLDPEHTEAWSIYVEATVPARGEQMTMLDAAQALAGVKKNRGAGPVKVGHVGSRWAPYGGRPWLAYTMRLHWWQKCRNFTPDEATPLVEMASILADMGEYEEAQRRLEAILEENMDVPDISIHSDQRAIEPRSGCCSVKTLRKFSDLMRSTTMVGRPSDKK